MFRKRRKQRVTWFPLLGAGYLVHEDIFNSWNLTGALNFEPLSGGVAELLDIRPIVWDAPLEQGGAGNSDQAHQLVDFVGNEYILNRIVGKFFGWIDSNQGTAGPAGPQAFQVAAGLFVARSDDTSGTLGEDKPVGANGADAPSLYSPDHIDTTREPWLWRRRWILGNILAAADGAAGATPLIGAQLFPTTTVQGAGIFDGAHVDSKVKRRISNDDRLWLAVSAKPFPLGTDYDQGDFTLTIRYSFDARVLGSLRKAKAKSAF